MNNNFGIYDKSYELILNAIAGFHDIEKAVVFGSRAMGNYKKSSDIDLAIFGKNIDYNTTSQLHRQLNESLPIPYFIDVIDFNTIDNQQLRKEKIR